MKPLALVLVLASSTILAIDKPTLPPEHLCYKIKGLEDMTACDGGLPIDYSAFDLNVILEGGRNLVFFLGFQAANAYYPPPLTTQQEKQRELGRHVMEAAPYLAFPELGDVITKGTPAVAYCSSSAGNEPLDPWNSQNVKTTGKGQCLDFMTVYLREPAKH